MTTDEVQQIVENTVKQTLIQLGVDAQNPIELQKDMAHLRAWRESIYTVKRQSFLTAIAIITTGIFGVIWIAIKDR